MQEHSADMMIMSLEDDKKELAAQVRKLQLEADALNSRISILAEALSKEQEKVRAQSSSLEVAEKVIEKFIEKLIRNY